jgi:hypothetical protein
LEFEVMIVATTNRGPVSPQHLRSRIVLIASLVAVGFAGLAAQPRPAIAGGVHFDPESPAGKEYALPLSQARNEGAGKSGVSKAGSVEPAPLFGEGVSGPGGPSAPAPAGSRGAQNLHGPRQPGHGLGASVGHAVAKGGSIADASSSYSMTSAVGLVAAIVLLGAGLGLGVRGLQRIRTG